MDDLGSNPERLESGHRFSAKNPISYWCLPISPRFTQWQLPFFLATVLACTARLTIRTAVTARSQLSRFCCTVCRAIYSTEWSCMMRSPLTCPSSRVANAYRRACVCRDIADYQPCLRMCQSGYNNYDCLYGKSNLGSATAE